MPQDKVCWGLLSTARINERLIPCLRASKRCELVAVASRDQQRAEQYSDRWQIQRAYGSYEAMLADPEIDAVYISLPNGLHAKWAVRSAAAGKHVLCEKPLAISTGQVDQLIEASDRNGVIIQEAAMMRYHPQTRYMRELVARRAAGDIRLIRGVFTYVLENQHDVRLDPAQGGGSLWDLGSYCVSFCRAVLAEEPSEVTALSMAGPSGVDLSLAGQMRFACGAIGQFFSSLASFAHVEADLHGTTGRIKLTSPWVNQLNRDIHVHLIRHDGSPPQSTWDDGMDHQATETRTFRRANGYEHEVASMVGSILDGAEPVVSLADSRCNIGAILGLLESVRTGTTVKLPRAGSGNEVEREERRASSVESEKAVERQECGGGHGARDWPQCRTDAEHASR